MARLSLSTPWVEYYHEVSAMFRYDPDIKIIYDEDERNIKIYVDSPRKAAALSELLPEVKTFGNVSVRVTIVPSNKAEEEPDKEENLYERAFKNNPAFCFCCEVKDIFSAPIIYVVFDNTVVQYFTDNLGDLNGVRSTLYQDIAKEIFTPVIGVFYCTDLVESDLHMSLWPC